MRVMTSQTNGKDCLFYSLFRLTTTMTKFRITCPLVMEMFSMAPVTTLWPNLGAGHIYHCQWKGKILSSVRRRYWDYSKNVTSHSRPTVGHRSDTVMISGIRILMRPGFVFCQWLRRVLANEKRRYICNVFLIVWDSNFGSVDVCDILFE